MILFSFLLFLYYKDLYLLFSVFHSSIAYVVQLLCFIWCSPSPTTTNNNLYIYFYAV